MARKWTLFFRHLQSILRKHSITWIIGLLTALCCVVLHPFLSLASDVSTSQQLTEQGQKLYESEQYTDAIVSLQAAIASYRKSGDRLKLAASLSNLALVQQQLGNWREAQQAISESLQQLQSSPLPGSASVLAQTLDIQGQVKLSQGKTEAALSTWEQSEKLYTQLENRSGVVRSRIYQCHALRVLGYYRRAQILLQELQQTLKPQPDSIDKVIALRALGNALERSRDISGAEKVLEESLTIANRLKAPDQISATLLSLGNIAQDQNQAIAFYEKSAQSDSGWIAIQSQLNLLRLRIERQETSQANQLTAQIQSKLATLPANRTRFDAQVNFAQSLAKLDLRKDSALVLANVIQASKQLNDRRTQAYALGNLGDLYRKQEDWENAETVTKQALLLIEPLNAAEIAYQLHSQLGDVLTKQGGKDESAIAAYSVAISTLNSLRKDLVDVNRDVQFSFRESVEPTYRELVRLLLKPENQDASGKNRERARNLIEALQVAELDNFFREACLNAERVIIDQVVDQDNPNTAIIYPIVLKDELQVIVKIPQQPVLSQHRVPKSKLEVEKILKELQEALVQPDPTKQLKALSGEVYSWLVKPFEAQFKDNVNTLVFVLDGAFRSIPMATLYDSENKQFLIQKKYAIAVNLGLQLQSPQQIAKSPLKVLAAGLAQPSGELGKKFGNLPGVVPELAAIRAAGISVTELKDKQFSIEGFSERVKEAPYNVIHMATHGQFSSDAQNTFLLANDNKITVGQFDQLIRDRARIQRTPIELLVLSACETATGDDRATLGLAGVAVKAGAQSTVASLWKVKDRSTALLIGEFYRQLKTQNVSRAEALRLAQLKLLEGDSGFNAPLHWAPFILIGNWL